MDRHRLAGRTVTLKVGGKDPFALNGKAYRIEDWWVNVGGKSWMDCVGNPACLQYAARSSEAGLPTDGEVVYGKVGCFGYLIHESELGEEVVPA